MYNSFSSGLLLNVGDVCESVWYPLEEFTKYLNCLTFGPL